MKKRKTRTILLSVLIILALVAVSICIHYIRTHNKIKRSNVQDIYLYHTDSVDKIAPDNSTYKELTDAILSVLNKSNIYYDTLDELRMFKGNGETLESDMTDYLIEVIFSEPVSFTIFDHEYNAIYSVLISTENNNFYLFDDNRTDEITSIASYHYNENVLQDLTPLIQEYFSS